MELEKLARIAVGIDPSGGHDPENDEQGIVVGGIGYDDHGYVLGDLSCRLSPDGWARRALEAYERWQANYILWESNFGGEMVEWTIKATAQDMGIVVKTKKVVASRGKAIRAEPVAALYEQARIHHLGVFPELETQMCEWTPNTNEASPDRLDALCMVFTDLMVDPVPEVVVSNYREARLRRR